ncbi:MAG: hypothetical protein AAGF12_20085 [Myxococcota bacterium]
MSRDLTECLVAAAFFLGLLGCGASPALAPPEPTEVAPLPVVEAETTDEPLFAEPVPPLNVQNPPAINWTVFHRAPDGSEQLFDLQVAPLSASFAEWRCTLGRQQRSTRVMHAPGGERIIARDTRLLVCTRPGQTEAAEVGCGYDSDGTTDLPPVNDGSVDLPTAAGLHAVTLHCELGAPSP